MEETDYELLQERTMLGHLPETLRAWLLEDAFVLSMAPGTVLFSQGEAARFLHVILSGRVALMAGSDDGGETVIELFRDGDVFIAPAVLLEMPYLMSARVVAQARILMVEAERFRGLHEREHALTWAMSRELAGHWRRLIRQLKDLKLRSAPARLASFLLTLAQGAEGHAVVELPEERQMLARHLGMTPESFSRAFARLREFGVEGRGRRVRLDDLEALRRFCAYDDLV